MKKLQTSLKLFSYLILILITSICYGLPFTLCKMGNKTELTDATIQYFANATTNSLFTFTFINYKELSKQSHFLSSKAWGEYNDYLTKSGLLKNVATNQLVIGSYFITLAEIISNTGDTWKVNVPFIFVSKSASDVTFKPLIVTMSVAFNDKQTYDCGLKVTEIQFNPETSDSIFDKIKSSLGSTQLPYQETNITIQKSEDIADLRQPIISDIDVITAVNSWLIKQANFTPSMLNAPLIIIGKGVMEDKFTWRVQVNKETTVLASRDNNSPYGLYIR